MKNLCVIGTGYVGLVGAAIFADWGNTVVGVDIDINKIKMIEEGVMPIFEPGLSEIVLKNIKENRLSFTTTLVGGVKDAGIIFICVGTPQSDTGHADLSYVWGVAKEIGQLLQPEYGYKVIVTKSTVPVGTNERVKKLISDALVARGVTGVEFDVASNPEFLREGSSVEDMRGPDRTVVGTENEKAMATMRELYAHLQVPLVECDLRSAEMIKYASNAYLATKISFINEIGQLCEKAGANVGLVADGMGLDKRIGRAFLNVSIGYGGSCFPKDVAALYKTSADQAYDFKLIRAVMEVNELQRLFYIRKVKAVFGENLTGVTLGVLGLAFKNNTDDIRESIAIKIVRDLRGMGTKIKAFDPQAMINATKVLGNEGIVYVKSAYDAMDEVDGLCLLTEWNEFRSLDMQKAKELMKGAVIFDGRNLLNQEQVEDLGFVYFALGKRTNGYETKLLEKWAENGTSAVLKGGK